MSINKIHVEVAMGRPRKDMVKLVESCQDVIQEHLWKLFAYHKDRPQDVNGWLETIRRYLPQLQLYNKPKTGKKLNVDKEFLVDQFITELFQDGDQDTLNDIWALKGFPQKFLIELDYAKCRRVAEKFVDCILDSKRIFTITAAELL